MTYNLYIMFLNIEETFISVHRRSLRKITGSYGILHKIITMFKVLNSDSEFTVLDEVETRIWDRIGHEKT